MSRIGDTASTQVSWVLTHGNPQTECRRGDLYPHDLAITSPSSWRVCLFRHSDVVGERRYRVDLLPDQQEPEGHHREKPGQGEHGSDAVEVALRRGRSERRGPGAAEHVGEATAAAAV